MPRKTLLVGLLAATLALSACAPAIIVGTAAVGGLTASQLNPDASGSGNAAPGGASEAAMVSPPPPAPVEPVQSQPLE